MRNKLTGWLENVFCRNSYSSDLENYIIENNPKFPSDVERLTIEYSQKQIRKFYGI